MALDTNVLIYAEGGGDSARCRAARELLEALPGAAVVLPMRCLRNGHTSWAALQSALDLTARQRLPIWDALILSVAGEQRCRLLFVEDFPAGFVWHGVTVVDPFTDARHPLLLDLRG